MVKVTITKEVHDAIRAAAVLPFKDTSIKLPNGEYEIVVDDEVYERITKLQLAGETISDTLLRSFAALALGGKLN